MPITVSVQIDSSGLGQLLGDYPKRAGQAIVGGLREIGDLTKTRLRAQVQASGLGVRLGNTWQLQVYENQLLNATALVYSKAPKLMGVYSKGAIIKPQGGRKSLAIRTRDCPAKGTDGKSCMPRNFPVGRLGPLRYVPPLGGRRYGMLVINNAKLGSKSVRAASASALARGTGLVTVPMFVLIPFTTVRKRLDLDLVAGQATAQLPGAIVARLS
jgi:hypothetical protein